MAALAQTLQCMACISNGFDCFIILVGAGIIPDAGSVDPVSPSLAPDTRQRGTADTGGFPCL